MNWETMNKIYVETLVTRRFVDDDPVTTTLTLDYSNVTIDDLLTKAIKSDKISWQAGFRNKKGSSKIPTVATYVVPKPGTRSARPVTPEGLVSAFGGDVDRAIEALRAIQANK
jgi:hypothetical protein